jgi:pyocin large subunit-like protein
MEDKDFKKAFDNIARDDGALLRFDLKSNTFGSFTPEGVPKTMFRPQLGEMPSRYSTALEYFYGQ